MSCRSRFIQLLLPLLVAGAPVRGQEAGLPVSLLWRNGDILGGELLPGQRERVAFLAKPFAAPFDLATEQLLGIRFPASPAPATNSVEPLFEFHLRNSDSLLGRLGSISEDSVVLHSDLFLEELKLSRSELLRVVRVDSREDGFSGLGTLDQWTSYGRDRKPTDWFTGLRGELATHQWSGNLFRGIDFPEKVEIRFRVRFPAGHPNLQVGLVREAELGPMLETWENKLVLSHGSSFVPLIEMGEQTRELNLRIFWNQATDEILVCDASGKPLGNLSVKTGPANSDQRRRQSDPLRRGFSILSRNPEMNFLSLEVREWDGKPTRVDLAEARVEFRNSNAPFPGADLRLAEGSGTLRIGTEDRPVADLLEWVLSSDSAERASSDDAALRGSTRIAWHAGASLSGRFIQIKETGVEIHPAWSGSPLLVKSAGIRELRFPDVRQSIAPASDVLEAGSLKIRGTLRLDSTSASKDGALLAWLAPGASAEVPFARGLPFTVTRNPISAEPVDEGFNLGQGRLYLDSEEILSGKLLALDPDQAAFESNVTGRVEVPREFVRAIDLGLKDRVLRGFSDLAWEEQEEAEDEVVLSDDTVTIRAGGFGNPTLLLGDRIHFDTQWQESYGAVTVRLFAGDADSATPSTDLIIAAQGNRLFIGKLNESGAFSFSGDQIPIVANRAAIDIHTTDGRAEIFVNGKSALKLDIEPGKVSGNGIFFKMGGGWQGWNQGETSIIFSDFRIEQSPGSVPRRIIDPRAKHLSLSIPRSLRDHAPGEILIAANGDLLRGDLISAGSDLLVFSSGGKRHEFPTSRIASIVRLDEPSDHASAPELPEKPAKNDLNEEDDEETPTKVEDVPPQLPEKLAGFEVTHQLVLRDGSRVRLRGENVADRRLVGSSPVLGTCRIPLDQVRELRYAPAVQLSEFPAPKPLAFNDWGSVFTPDPKIPEPGDGQSSPLIGTAAPDFELSTLGPDSAKLSALRGKVIVLDFWATWCGPCIKAMPEVQAAVQAFPEGTVAFLTVNQGETPPIIEEFLAGREWSGLPVALDFDMKVSKAYQATEIPHTIVIDREGRIAWVHTGMSEELRKDLFEAIAKTLQTQ